MEIKIRTKNFNSNAGIKELAEKELTRVQKMVVPDTIFDVCVKKEEGKNGKSLFKCDITIKNGREFLRGYAEGDDVKASIDMAVDSLKRKIRKAKTYAEKRNKEYDKFIAPEYKEKKEENVKEKVVIERLKEIEVDVMTVDEAAMQMELSGHDFFVFKNEKGN
jgi:putative sigma-54 modulation protein